MQRPIRRLSGAIVNVATLVLGVAFGVLGVAFWGRQQPTNVLAMSTLDPAIVEEPFVIPFMVWAIGIGFGLLIAAALLKYFRRI